MDYLDGVLEEKEKVLDVVNNKLSALIMSSYGSFVQGNPLSRIVFVLGFVLAFCLFGSLFYFVLVIINTKRGPLGMLLS